MNTQTYIKYTYKCHCISLPEWMIGFWNVIEYDTCIFMNCVWQCIKNAMHWIRDFFNHGWSNISGPLLKEMRENMNNRSSKANYTGPKLYMFSGVRTNQNLKYHFFRELKRRGFFSAKKLKDIMKIHVFRFEKGELLSFFLAWTYNLISIFSPFQKAN